MSEQEPWVSVPEDVLAAVGSELTLLYGCPRGADVPTADIPRSLLSGLIEFFSEDLGCDHAVNICMCDIVHLVSALRLSQEGKEHCPTCGGDGVGVGEHESGPGPCVDCGGNGWVMVDGE